MLNTVHDNDRFQRKLEDRSHRPSALRLLVVDDEPSILEVVKTALETLGNYNVSVASSAHEAIEIVDNSDDPFDCFLLDIQMPDVDGIELLREIRSLPEYTDTPVLMLTAMSDRTYIDQAFLEGASDYVNKPFDFLELRSRIKCAHELVEARRETESSQRCASDLKSKLSRGQFFAFDDPISLIGAARALRYIEFDNYVAQLARRKLFSSQAISVMLQDAELFYNLAGCESFRKAISDVAECIQRATDGMECVFSYRGKGIFLVILHGTRSERAVGPANLNALMGAALRQHVNDDRVEVLVGSPVSMRVLSRSGTQGVLQKALSAVQELEAELRKHDNYAISTHEDGEEPNPSTAGQKRVYERVLHELFGEESYLNVR